MYAYEIPGVRAAQFEFLALGISLQPAGLEKQGSFGGK